MFNKGASLYAPQPSQWQSMAERFMVGGFRQCFGWTFTQTELYFFYRLPAGLPRSTSAPMSFQQ